MSNIRPIADPSLATAMVATFQSIDQSRSAPAGISSPRWRILQCAHAGNAAAKSLQLCSGLNARALAEHVQSLRWKGLMDMDSYRLSPTAILMVEDCVLAPAPTGKTGTVIIDEYESLIAQPVEPHPQAGAWFLNADPMPLLSAFDAAAAVPVFIGADFSTRSDMHAEFEVTISGGKIVAVEPLDPADVPACMRPDCTSPEETNSDGRGSAAVARPIEGELERDRVAPDRALETTMEVAGSNPAPGQPGLLTPELVEQLRKAIPARASASKPVAVKAEPKSIVSGDPWEMQARRGSEELIRAIRRHHPERCGEA